MTMRSIKPANPLLNQVISGVTPVQSSALNLSYMFSADAAYTIVVGAGLTATFQVMISDDGLNYVDSGKVLPSVSGSSKTFPVEYSGAFPYVLIQVSPSAGSGSVKIIGSAKGGA